MVTGQWQPNRTSKMTDVCINKLTLIQTLILEGTHIYRTEYASHTYLKINPYSFKLLILGYTYIYEWTCHLCTYEQIHSGLRDTHFHMNELSQNKYVQMNSHPFKLSTLKGYTHIYEQITLICMYEQTFIPSSNPGGIQYICRKWTHQGLEATMPGFIKPCWGIISFRELSIMHWWNQINNQNVMHLRAGCVTKMQWKKKME